MITSFDYYKQIENPDMYLCNPDQRFLCALNGQDRMLTLRFNDLSELTFTVPKIEGTENSYNLIETKRLVFVDKIGWFQITSVTETIEGDRYSKNVTAKSHQTTFADRGFVTEERVYMFYNPNDPMDKNYKSENKKAIPSVCGQLYQQLGIRIALNKNDIEPTQDMKEWTLTYVDEALWYKSRSGADDGMYEPAAGADNVCRSFESQSDSNGYDFIINQVEEAFNVIFEFDFLYHTIKVKTFDAIANQPTDIYLSFQNVMNNLEIQEDSNDIVTVMSCEGNGLDITTVNPMGTNYIVDFSYYMKERNDDGVEYPWMSKELIDALKEWKGEYNKWCNDDNNRAGHIKGYSTLVEDLQKIYADKSVYDADLQFANLKITDMLAARDQYAGNKDKELDGSEYVTAESVAVQKTSLLPASKFYTIPFDESVVITGHIKAPKPKKIIDNQDSKTGQIIQYHYEFGFDDAGTEDTAKSLIRDYIGSDDKDEDIQPTPLYFIDDNGNRSYCKLKIDSEVGVVKDADGFIAKEGTVQIRGVTFKVKGVTGGCEITLPDGSTITTSQSNSYFIYNGSRYRALVSADEVVSIYCFYVSGFDRYTTYTEAGGSQGWVELWMAHVNNDIEPQIKSLQAEIDTIKTELKYITDICEVQKFIRRKGLDLYNELTTYWVEGSYSSDNFATYDNTTMAERIDLAKQLMNAAKIDLEKAAQPKYELSVDAINFIKLIEFKRFSDELALGKSVTVEKSDDVLFTMALMSIEYNLDSSDAFTLTFSNASKPGETAMTFADLFKEASSVSRTVSSNWSNLTDYSRNKEEITNLILAPLDRTLRAAQENMANQEFLVDNTGILGRKWTDDSGTSFEKEQVRIINNTILFTNDNWETASLALGKIQYGENGEEAYGLVASVLVGELILGEAMSIGSKSERVRIDDSGIVIKNDDGDDVFYGDKDGNLTIQGTIRASAGNFGVLTIENDGSITSTTGHFSVDKNGNLIAKGGGTIGGYTITDKALTSGNVGMSSDTTSGAYAFWAGNTTAVNAPFSVTNTGNIVATMGNIGNLSLENGSLYSQNFRLETIRQNNSTNSWLKFYNSRGDETTTISDEDITTVNVTASGYINTPTVLADSLKINDGISIAGKTIIGSTTCLEFDGSGESESYTAILSYSKSDNYLKVTLNDGKTLRYSRSFQVKYKVIWGQSYSTATVNIAAGRNSGETTVSAFWGIDHAYFPGYQQQLNFTQQTGVSQINVKGSLVPSGSGYDLGTKDHPWNELRITTGYMNDVAISTSDIKHKNTVAPINEIYSLLFDELKPVTYKLNYGQSGRTHLGLIAQDVKNTMNNLGISEEQFAVYCSWLGADNETTCGLRYGELIPLCILEIQKLKREIKQLKGV